MTIRDNLIVARKIIAEHGRAKVSMYDASTGRSCAMGAVLRGEGWEPDGSDIETPYNLAATSLGIAVLDKAIRRYIEDNSDRFPAFLPSQANNVTRRVYTFNDSSAVTQRDVLATFDLAIEMAATA